MVELTSTNSQTNTILMISGRKEPALPMVQDTVEGLAEGLKPA